MKKTIFTLLITFSSLPTFAMYHFTCFGENLRLNSLIPGTFSLESKKCLNAKTKNEVKAQKLAQLECDKIGNLLNLKLNSKIWKAYRNNEGGILPWGGFWDSACYQPREFFITPERHFQLSNNNILNYLDPDQNLDKELFKVFNQTHAFSILFTPDNENDGVFDRGEEIPYLIRNVQKSPYTLECRLPGKQLGFKYLFSEIQRKKVTKMYFSYRGTSYELALKFEIKTKSSSTLRVYQVPEILAPTLGKTLVEEIRDDNHFQLPNVRFNGIYFAEGYDQLNDKIIQLKNFIPVEWNGEYGCRLNEKYLRTKSVDHSPLD